MGSAKDNFKKGAVEMLLLTMLCEEDMYGYQMAQLVKSAVKGKLRSRKALCIPPCIAS